MSVRLNRPRLVYLILLIVALLAYYNDMMLLVFVLIAINIYIGLKYMKSRMYFSINELPEFNRPKPDEPICSNCDYDLRGTFAAGIFECPECNQRADEETITNWKNAKHTV
ncbi:MAG: hypothetical protein IH984_09310 [Planctomycetes bacterium]|nr:hypothetical protein [Planctomycetota bacterium]